MSGNYFDWNFEDIEAKSLLKVTCSEAGVSDPEFFRRGDTHHLFLLGGVNESYTIVKIDEIFGEMGRSDWAAADDFVYEDEVIGKYLNLKEALKNFEDEATSLIEQYSDNPDDEIHFLTQDIKELEKQVNSEDKISE